jgi:hypothetical protein
VKAVFGFLALVLVLAVVASLVKHQLHAANGGAAAAVPGAIVADPNTGTASEQARALQERARAETARALEQGAERNRRADP